MTDSTDTIIVQNIFVFIDLSFYIFVELICLAFLNFIIISDNYKFSLFGTPIALDIETDGLMGQAISDMRKRRDERTSDNQFLRSGDNVALHGWKQVGRPEALQILAQGIVGQPLHVLSRVIGWPLRLRRRPKKYSGLLTGLSQQIQP